MIGHGAPLRDIWNLKYGGKRLTLTFTLYLHWYFWVSKQKKENQESSKILVNDLSWAIKSYMKK